MLEYDRMKRDSEMKKSSEKEKRRPTLLQLQYLIEWEKLGGNWGDKAAVAEICGVKHNAVNYFFNGDI